MGESPASQSLDREAFTEMGLTDVLEAFLAMSEWVSEVSVIMGHMGCEGGPPVHWGGPGHFLGHGSRLVPAQYYRSFKAAILDKLRFMGGGLSSLPVPYGDLERECVAPG